MFSVNNSGINKGSFGKICPAIVEQIDSKSCNVIKREEHVAAYREKRSTKREGNNINKLMD